MPPTVTEEDLWDFHDMGWSDEQGRAAIRAGLDGPTAGRWLYDGLRVTPEQVLAWWSVLDGGTDPVEAYKRFMQWVEAGLVDPAQRVPGVGPTTTLMCAIAGVPVDPAWGERLTPAEPYTSHPAGSAEFLCPTLVAQTAALGQEPALAAVMLDLLKPVIGRQVRVPGHDHPRPTPGQWLWGRDEYRCGWHGKQVEQVQAYLRSLAGLDWADLVTCLRARLSPEQAREYVASGADMEPVRLMAALTG